MSALLSVLRPFQRFYIPALVFLLAWAIWRTVWRKDLGVGLALYLGLVIVVDGYLNTGIFLPGLEQGSIRYSEVCALFLFFNRPPAARRPSSSAALICFLVAAYFTLLFVSALRSDPVMAGIFEFRRLIVPQIVAFMVAIRGVRSADDFRRFFLSVSALSLGLAVFVFWDLFFEVSLLRSDLLAKPEYFVNRQHGRFGSFFLNPNYLGAFTVLIFPAMFVWAVGEQRRSLKAAAATGLLSLAFCLVETQSRGPMLAFVIALVLMLLGPGGGVSRARRVGLFLVFIAVFSVFMPGFLDHATERFRELEEETTTEVARSRATAWLYTQRAIGDSPLAGIGFGEQQFLNAMTAYGFEATYGAASVDNPHNSYLQMAVYAGIPALLVFVFANVVLLARAGWSILRRPLGAQRQFAFGLAVGVTAFLAVIYPDMHMFTLTVAPAYWLFFGLLFSLAFGTPAAASAAIAPESPLPADALRQAAARVRPLPGLVVRGASPLGEPS